jgi:RNA polymerase sigma-70 factor, ECF subfamily
MDTFIIRRLRKNETKAYELIFHKYYNVLLSYCIKFIKNREEAKEIVNDTFVKLWENRANIKDVSSLKPYLFQIVHNLSINHLKRSLRRTTIVLESFDLDNVEFAYNEYFPEGDEIMEILINAISKLPLERRKVFILSRFKDLKYSEIAGKLGISIKTVETQISRSLSFIRNELSKYNS